MLDPEAVGHPSREVPGVVLIKNLVDAFVEKVVVVPRDDPLGDEDHYLAQLPQLGLAADGVGPVPGEAGGMVDQEDIELIHLGVLEGLLKAGALEGAGASYEVGVPSRAQGQAVALGEDLDGSPLELGAKPLR